MIKMIKVCGMRDAENIRQVEALGVDLMGFIFWPRSSRYVAERPSYLPTRCRRVGVFVDENIETVRRIADDYALDIIQLHGHESPDYCAQLQGHESPDFCAQLHGRPIIKAFNIATADDFVQTEPYAGLVDYFLFDTKGKSVGGNGVKFDWSVLSAYSGSTPYLLSGGIGPDDAPALRASFSVGCGPDDAPALRTSFSVGCGSAAANCVGIDLNSRFELAPGLKDVAALRQFLNEIKR